jgi:fatty acid desaturase
VSAPVDATRDARRALTAGMDAHFAELRTLRAGRRLAEIVLFSMLWAAGGWIGIAALARGGSESWLLRVIAIAMGATALNAFYLLSHEGHHHLLFRSRFANHAANILLCIPLLHSPSAYRVLHELHHRFLGGPGDPDEYRNYTGSARLRWALQWVRLTIGTLVYMPLIPVVAWRRATRGERFQIAAEYAGMSLVWALVFTTFSMGELLQVWLLPGIVVGYISAVRAVAQHALTDPHDPLLASRSVRSNRVVSFFLLNENYHLEHHLFPEIPSYNLPRLHTLLAPRLSRAVESPSYSRFLAAFVGRSLHGDESPLGVR